MELSIGRRDDFFQRYVGTFGQILDVHIPVPDTGLLQGKEEVNRIFDGVSNVICSRWQNSSFVVDPGTRTLQVIETCFQKVSSPCVALYRDYHVHLEGGGVRLPPPPT